MDRAFSPRGIWQMIFIIVNSAFAVFFLNSLTYGFSFETLFDSVLHAVVIGSCVCFSILYLIPRIQTFGRYLRFGLVTLAIIVSTFVGVFLTRLILGIYYKWPGAFYWPNSRTIVFSLIISATFGFSAYYYITSQNKLEETKEKLKNKELDEAKARSLAVQAQLTSLESRIHPHFLFNTLNSIAALIKEDPVKAERMIERLSALLHYSLAMDTSRPVPLSEELRITCEYLEIESVRYEEKLEFTVSSENGIPSVVLPAFSLQTIVENVVKHVAARSSSVTRIEIDVGTTADKTIVRVKDNGPGFSVRDLKQGHGLDNLRNRLSNLREPTASLSIVGTGNGGVVELTIDAV